MPTSPVSEQMTLIRHEQSYGVEEEPTIFYDSIEEAQAALEEKQIVVSDAPPPVKVMTESQANACCAKIRKASGDLWQNLYKLQIGQGWIPLGYADWDEMCEAQFGYVSRQARRMKQYSRIYNRTLLELPDGVKPTLDKIPDIGLGEFDNLEGWQSAHIVDVLAQAEVKPTQHEILELISEMYPDKLTKAQLKRLNEMREEDGEITVPEPEDFAGDALKLIESIQRNLTKLAENEELIHARGYNTFGDLVRSEFDMLRVFFAEGLVYAPAEDLDN
jgi:hypothetical protein